MTRLRDYLHDLARDLDPTIDEVQVTIDTSPRPRDHKPSWPSVDEHGVQHVTLVFDRWDDDEYPG